jgi:FkbM family methyltransferase
VTDGAGGDPVSAPWWVAPGRRLIRALPAGRFRAAALAARSTAAPFVARMSPDHGGARFWCDLRDTIARDVCLIGIYEPQVSQVMAALLGSATASAVSSTVVVDVGANWGYFTLMAAELVGRSGRVLAVEPDPRMFALLQRNLSLNGLSQVDAVACAAGADRETRWLHGYADGAENRGVSRIRAGAGTADGVTAFAVRTAPLDLLLDERNIGAVDLIKIDVEGFEADVLGGMADGLATQRYRRIVIELHPALLAERGTTAEECAARLLAAGYTGWAFDHSPSAVRRAAYSRSLPLSALLTPCAGVPADDPWPHMLWTARDAPLTSHA